MDNIINKMKYELGDLKYQLMVLKEENRVMHLRNNEQAKKNDPESNLQKEMALNRSYVPKNVYEMLFDKSERQGRIIEDLKKNANSKMVFKLEKKVSELLSENKEMKERLERQGKTIQRLYNDTKINGCRYAFSNIPNDEEGNKFVEQMKLYFNYDSYDFRKRGQYLDNDKLSIGETWKTYEDGQPLSKSKCIRIYIDKKKEGK